MIMKIKDLIYNFYLLMIRYIQVENLINTAVLSGKQATVPMRIFSITEGGNLNDVTSSSYCLSAESRVLKASPSCSSIYVDGFVCLTNSDHQYHKGNYLLKSHHLKSRPIDKFKNWKFCWNPVCTTLPSQFIFFQIINRLC